MSRISAGVDVDAYCSRCAMELAHVVIAMNGARIAKVECKTCHTVHGYRDNAKSSTRSKSTAPKRSRTTRIPPEERDYARSIAGVDLARARAYRPSERFVEGEVLRHATFGIGVVVRELADDKIQVLFPDASRTLVHGR